MAKRSTTARKPSGASRIQTVEDSEHMSDDAPVEEANQSNSDDGDHVSPNGKAAKPGRTKGKSESQTGNLGVSEIRKAAAFANSVGGLDKAISLLQILKVAREVQ